MDYRLKEEILLKEYMPQNKDIKNLSLFFYGFSDFTRLKIIILLTIKPMCVGDISSLLSLNQSTVSHQLKILKSLDMVACDRSGKSVVYYIKNTNIENVLNVGVDCV